MPHEHKGGAVIGGSLDRLEAALCDSSGHNGLSNGGLIGIDNGSILANLTQQGLGNHDGLELVGVGGDSLHQLVILGTVHQMGGLHHQLLHATGNGALQRLIHVVDELAVTRLDMVNDNLCGEGAANSPVRESGGNGILNALDVRHAAAVVGSAEGYHQDFLFANSVGIAGVIQRGIAGIQAEVIRAGFLALHQLLLGIGQGIPGFLCGGTLGIGLIGAGLDIDGINQCGHLVGGGLIGIRIGKGHTGHAKEHGQCAQECNELFHLNLLLK